MSTTSHTDTPTLTFVVLEDAHGNTDETALYRLDGRSGDWVIVTVEKGDAHSSLDTAKALSGLDGIDDLDTTNTFGKPFRITRQITHLRKGSIWMPIVSDFLMQPTTPVQRIVTEIADLRAEAHRLNESAAYSGSYGSGAGVLTAKADAMQHVLDVLTADNDDD